MEEKYQRPSWDEYFMEIAHAVSARGTCDRGRTAVVIVKDKRIITTGYVGSAIGMKHCDEVGHQLKEVTHEDGRKTTHCLRTLHAEVNALCQAARFGVSVDGATLYCKMAPCFNCAKMLVNAGIKRVVCEKDYHEAKDAKQVFDECGVELEILKPGEVMEYDRQ